MKIIAGGMPLKPYDFEEPRLDGFHIAERIAYDMAFEEKLKNEYEKKKQSKPKRD